MLSGRASLSTYVRRVFITDDADLLPAYLRFIHAADEAQVSRQQIGIVGDEHPAHVELYLALARRLEQVERFCRRREQQHGIRIAPFGAVMQRHRRLVEGACDRLIGLRVVFRLQFRLWPLPQRARRIDLPRLALFRLEFNRKLDVVGIGADDAFDLVSLEVFFRLGF